MAEKMEFKISSGLKDIIGKELITDDPAAIFEIVKNSYDSRAKIARLSFQNLMSNDKHPKILVIDNGDGMSKNDIINKFLFVGYSEKKPQEKKVEKDYRDKIVERRRRHYAGSKGIGRFSCDRLGKKLKIYTKTSRESIIHTLEIDWTEFETDQKEEFETVRPIYEAKNTLEIEGIEIPNFQHGTILEITDLNSHWDDKKLLRLKLYLQRLINPSQVNSNLGFQIILEAEEYKELDKKNISEDKTWKVLNGVIENIVFEKMGMKTARVVTFIDEDGKEITTELHDKDKLIYRIKEKNQYTNLKNINAVVFYLSTQAKATFTRIMGIDAVNYGSILLYKNGVRVNPYGDTERGDWLGLNKLKQQGWRRYLGTREIIGRLEITGNQPGFIEVSSRDGGLLKNPHHEQLDNFMKDKVIIPLRRFVVEGLDWDREKIVKTDMEIAEDSIDVIGKLISGVKDKDKIVEVNPKILDISKEKESERLPEVIKNIEAIKKHVKDPEAKKFIDKQVKAIRKSTHAIKKKTRDTEKELNVVKRKNLFLEKTVDQDIEFVEDLNHSIKITTFSIEGAIDIINESIENNEPIENLVPMIDKISIENKKIQAITGLVSLATFDTTLERIEEDLVTFISEYLKRVVVMRSEKINVTASYGNIEFKKEFKPLEMSMILDNIIDNSIKATATKVTATYELKGKTLFVRISDNGKGVGKDDIKYLFSKGFTTTEGSGRGLHHTRKVLKSIGAEIKFIGNGVKGHEKGACFEVIFT